MRIIIGIDEVGRGPLAGPVSVGVVSCEEKIYKKLKNDRRLPSAGKDSKKLTASDRKKYSDFLKILQMEGKISYKIVHISNKIIDAKGLSFSIKKAIKDGMGGLNIEPKYCEVRLDGGLKAPEIFKLQRTIIKGDEKEKIIAWASILAKVSRDEIMYKAERKFPRYDLGNNKGYGTLKHREAIKDRGLSTFHRVSFCKNLIY